MPTNAWEMQNGETISSLRPIRKRIRLLMQCSGCEPHGNLRLKYSSESVSKRIFANLLTVKGLAESDFLDACDVLTQAARKSKLFF